MKTTVAISAEYNAVFIDVARKLAKGEPPIWLLIGLNHFSGGIGSVRDVRERMKSIIGQMQYSVDVLTKWLPIYQNLPFGIQCPSDVAVVLDALPRIKKDLERLSRTSEGQPPKMERKVCAAIIVEAWKLLHEDLELQLIYDACDDYWQACGGDQIGEDNDPKNWRRPVNYALAQHHRSTSAVARASISSLAASAAIALAWSLVRKSWSFLPSSTISFSSHHGRSGGRE